MKIIAFDLASRSGWACLSGGKVFSGILDLSALSDEEHAGARWPRVRLMFRALSDLSPPNVVAWERVLAAGGALPGWATELIVFQACLAEVAFAWGAETITIMPSTLKKWATCTLPRGTCDHKDKKICTGKGNAKKPEMIAAARKRWPEWVPANPKKPDDEADARWVLAWACEQKGVVCP